MASDPEDDRRPPTLGAILEALERDGLLDPEARERAREAATDIGSYASDHPWYLRVIAGVGAWLAAVLIVAAGGCSGIVDLHGIDPFVAGAAATVAGTLLYRLRPTGNDFFRQLALAAALIGEGLIAAGAYEQVGLAAAAAAYGGVAVVLYPIYDADAHRFLSILGAASLGSAAAAEAGPDWTLPVLFSAGLVVLCATFSEGELLSTRARLALRPAGYAAALSLLWIASRMYLRDFLETWQTWPYAVAASAALLVLVGQLTRHVSDRPLATVGLAAVPILGFGAVAPPGVVASSLVLFLGAARRTAILALIGGAALAYNTGSLFYAVDLSVAARSLALAGSGLALLILWTVLQLGIDRRPEGETT